MLARFQTWLHGFPDEPRCGCMGSQTIKNVVWLIYVCVRAFSQTWLHGLPDAKRHGMADVSVCLRVPRELRVSTSARGAHRTRNGDSCECLHVSQTWFY